MSESDQTRERLALVFKAVLDDLDARQAVMDAMKDTDDTEKARRAIAAMNQADKSINDLPK